MTLVEQGQHAGPFRIPRNTAQEIKGSIHDDATASKLGFKGGTVAGSIHMDQFVPALLDLHGEAWFATGGVSLMFKQATVDGEAVRAVVAPGADRAALTMFNEAGALICEGTANLGDDRGSELARRLKAQEPPAAGALRILAALKVGDEAADIPLSVTPDALAKRLATITEMLPAYGPDSLILPPSMAVVLAHGARASVVGSAGKAVGLFGALEVQHLAGPLKAGVDYLGRTRVHALAESPRTEAAWYDVTIADKGSGREIARVKFFLRFMKGSSPLWTA
ncbi:hypothetical protein [Phenylobacterium sp.]|uniref:hypothetical protein n=1 Tax=Phenylobacterium sp. TaxID=1871053 RepID=UPI0027353229|nr:hypothetical protein [Phenylobacterium sp.]MDP3852379.1 hypothetical protein [Phenylobacterium sp.]